jgi:hypothetical protein
MPVRLDLGDPATKCACEVVVCAQWLDQAGARRAISEQAEESLVALVLSEPGALRTASPGALIRAHRQVSVNVVISGDHENPGASHAELNVAQELRRSGVLSVKGGVGNVADDEDQ